MKVDFYVLETARGQQSLHFACCLLEKLYLEENRQIRVQVDSREEALRFDNLLWTFRDDSFVPHITEDECDNEYTTPIRIGFNNQPPRQSSILMNLCREIPPFYQQFNRILEIVFSDPVVQQLARARYRQYREQGYDMNTIKIKANEL